MPDDRPRVMLAAAGPEIRTATLVGCADAHRPIAQDCGAGDPPSETLTDLQRRLENS